jgi:pantoate--beta-alanine ligase
MCSDLLLAHPEPGSLHIVPTMRDVGGRLALSSRNAYLTDEERKVADTLYRALESAQKSWEAGLTKSQCLLRATQEIIEKTRNELDGKVEMRLDYLEVNDASSFDIIGDEVTKDGLNKPLVFSGALWLGKTRLIDNIVLGDPAEVPYA